MLINHENNEFDIYLLKKNHNNIIMNNKTDIYKKTLITISMN